MCSATRGEVVCTKSCAVLSKKKKKGPLFEEEERMVQNKKKIVSSTGSAGRMCFDTREGALRTAGLVRLLD